MGTEDDTLRHHCNVPGESVAHAALMGFVGAFLDSFRRPGILACNLVSTANRAREQSNGSI